MRKATAHDVLGLRQRVTAVYGAPQWSTISAIRAACQRLPTATKTDFMGGLCYPLLRWACQRPGMTFVPRSTRPRGSQLRRACRYAARCFPPAGRARGSQVSWQAAHQVQPHGFVSPCPPNIVRSLALSHGGSTSMSRRTAPRRSLNLLIASATTPKTFGSSWISHGRDVLCQLLQATWHPNRLLPSKPSISSS